MRHDRAECRDGRRALMSVGDLFASTFKALTEMESDDDGFDR
jgi:hypothetical protein